MPFRKRRFKRKQKNGAGKEALRKVNKLMKNTEKKFVDTDNNVTTTGTVIIAPLNLIGQGDSSSSREGNKVVLSTLQLKYSWKMASGASIGGRMRTMIVLDKQTNGAVFTAGELLQSTGLGTAIVSPLNLDGAFRFKVLYNKVDTLTPSGKEIVYHSLFKKINIPCRYSGSGGAIEQVLSNGLYIVHVSDASSNSPTIDYYARMRFIDS